MEVKAVSIAKNTRPLSLRPVSLKVSFGISRVGKSGPVQRAIQELLLRHVRFVKLLGVLSRHNKTRQVSSTVRNPNQNKHIGFEKLSVYSKFQLTRCEYQL